MAETSISVYGGMFDSTEVTETVGGFPRGNKAVDSEFFAKMISCFYKDGVLGEDSFAVSAGDGLSVRVSPGIAWARGYMAWMKNEEVLSLAPGSVYKIMLRLNLAAGEFSLVLSDNAGYTPQNGENFRDLVFASVSVPESAVSIEAQYITDLRAERDYCGIVTSTVDALNTVDTAQNAYSLGGNAASAYLKKSGGTMTGALTASSDSTGACIVRNIGYGTSLPDTLGDGELFVLLSTD